MRLPTEGVFAAEAVMRHGDKKHPGEEWKGVPKEVHLAHAKAHLDEYLSGIRADHESGLSPLAHVICRILMVMWLEKHGG